MIIQESSVNLSSQHLSLEEHHKKESLTYWQNRNSLEPGAGNTGSMTNMSLSSSSVKVSLSAEGVQKSNLENTSDPEREEIMGDLNIRILRDLIERITGKKIKFSKPHGNEQHRSNNDELSGEKLSKQKVEMPGFGLEYEMRESTYEIEKTSFSASGKIVTTDGEEVEFSLDLNMSREFYQENSINIKMGEALKDPLVVNFGGTAAQLTSTKFAFDIDADGTADSISFVSPESGFLALDKNNDGIINDGNELFGALTGNGFSEISEYDSDDNGWIDETDPIYDNLKIWSKNEEGVDTLISIGMKGIGAIYLGNIATPFEVNNSENDQLGFIRSSSVFVKEDYTVGTVQQVDLVA